MLKVGVVGCGFMGTMHCNVYQAIEGVELVAVADRREDKRSSFSAKFGVPAYDSLADMLAAQDLDIVDICLPTFQHKSAMIEAANAGKHVLCEKPMALIVEDADAMNAAAEANGITFMIAHCIRFWPEYAALKEAVDDGRYGKLLSVNLLRYAEFPHWSTDNWLADESLSGGGVLDMHIHDSDFILYLLGEPQSSASSGTVDARGPSHVFTTLQYPGCVAHLEGGWNLPTNTPFKMAFRAVFERGAMIMDAGPLTIYEPGKEPFVPVFEEIKAEGGGNISSLGGYFAEIKYFTDCLKAGTKPTVVTAQTSRRSLEFTLNEISQIKTSQS